MKATLKGWEYAKEHRAETIDIVLEVMKKEHIPTNKVHQSWMLDKVLDLIESGTKNVKKGELAESDYQKTLHILIEGGYINTKIEFNKFYKPVIEK
jgi:NitT/TauT family transport system substrate-binding protein